MSTRAGELQLEGVVHAEGYLPDSPGKQFVGAILECLDGGRWVIGYEEQSPFHALHGCRVRVSGHSYAPTGQHIILRKQFRGHLQVSSMTFVSGRADAEIIEIGPNVLLHGRLEFRALRTRPPMLSFVGGDGSTFFVANEPAGTLIDKDVEVSAYPVKASAWLPDERYLWVICPYSMADLWNWRQRPRTTLSRRWGLSSPEFPS